MSHNHFGLNWKVFLMRVSDSGQLEKKLEDVSSTRRDLEESKHIKTLEKQMKGITQERDELRKVGTPLYGVWVCVC